MKQRRRQFENDDGQSKLRELGNERLVTELRLALARANDVANEIQRRLDPDRKARVRGADPRTLLVGSPEWNKVNAPPS